MKYGFSARRGNREERAAVVSAAALGGAVEDPVDVEQASVRVGTVRRTAGETVQHGFLTRSRERKYRSKATVRTSARPSRRYHGERCRGADVRLV